MRVWFWRRLAAIWIDSFVIYAITVILIAVTAIVRIRIAFEPLYIVLAAVYGTALIARGGRTIGKSLLGVVVTTRSGDKPNLKAALVREIFGKWGIGVAMPVTLGRVIVGRAWVATLYDFLILLPVLLGLLVHYLIARRTWYDQLAGTTVERVLRPSGLRTSAFIALIGLAVLGLGAKAREFAAQGWIPCRLAIYRSMRSTVPYATFLKQKQAAPVDYVIGLFDRYDVVVFCERMHPEASQWEFVYELVSDPRFSQRVGHVFTEYGQVGMQAYLDSFMATDGLDAGEVHKRVVHVMRNFAVWPVWTNTNFYTYLTRLYGLNQSLPVDRRIHHHFTDISVNWSGLTGEEYWAYRRSLRDRDERMAQVVIDEMGRLAQSGSTRPKCLVVMNYRHAFDLTGGSPESRRINTYEYLKDSFADRAANVLLNTRIIISVPIAGGLWDASFEETGERPAGFDFEGSPFGEDPFDMFPFQPTIKGRLKYRDVFTGLVYAHPPDDQYLQQGVPGYYEGFEEEALRRAKLVSEDYARKIETAIYWAKKNPDPYKQELPGREIESLLELFLLALNAVGLLIGVGAFALGRSGRPRARRWEKRGPHRGSS